MTNQQRNGMQLSGDWSIESVANQKKQLEKVKLASDGQPFVLDLSGIGSIDSSGCQLIAVWLRHLRECGVEPKIEGLPDELAQYIRLIGFETSLAWEEQFGRN